MRRIGLSLLIAVAITSPYRLTAQRIDEARVAMHNSSTDMAPAQASALVSVASRTSASTGSMVMGGLIGGVLGAFAGAAVGISAENCQRTDDDYCGVAGGVIGGLLGEAIGVPVGVNWVANGSGTLGKTIPASIAMSAVCLVLGFATSGTSVLMMPPMQIYTSIRAERTGKSGFLAW